MISAAQILRNVPRYTYTLYSEEGTSPVYHVVSTVVAMANIELELQQSRGPVSRRCQYICIYIHLEQDLCDTRCASKFAPFLL